MGHYQAICFDLFSTLTCVARVPLHIGCFTADVCIFSCEAGSCKPEAEIYKRALTPLGETTDRCLFVGDGRSDEHMGAVNVGMVPLLLTHYLDEQTILQRSREHEHVLSARVDYLGELVTLLDGSESE